MTVVSRKTTRKSRPGDSTECKGRIFLAIACLWPLCLLALFSASAPHIATDGDKKRALSLQFRNVLDRVDIMGYGPTHPRVAVVITGKDLTDIQTTVESVLDHTDRNRIFIIAVVVDGKAEDARFVDDLKQLDVVQHVRTAKEMPSEQKIHVIFNEQDVGLYQSRSDAIHFIHLLEDSHETEGLKSHEEDLILVLMQGGTQMVVRCYLWMCLLIQLTDQYTTE